MVVGGWVTADARSSERCCGTTGFVRPYARRADRFPALRAREEVWSKIAYGGLPARRIRYHAVHQRIAELGPAVFQLSASDALVQRSEIEDDAQCRVNAAHLVEA